MTDETQKMEEELCAKYPELFRRDGDNWFSSDGFCCGAGWKDILDRLASDLIQLAENENATLPVVVQVKEKVGTLRFYTDFATESMSQRIRAAMAESLRVCEVCGARAERKCVAGWWATRCQAHTHEIEDYLGVTGEQSHLPVRYRWMDEKDIPEGAKMASELCENYPDIFTFNENTAFAEYGCLCDSGWKALIERTAQALMQIAREESREPPRAANVKQKFGALVIQLQGLDELKCPRYRKLLQSVLEESRSICEICGADAQPDWHKTLCDSHREELELPPVDADGNAHKKWHIAVGPGWEKDATHFACELQELGFSPRHIRSRNGSLEVIGEGVVTKKVASAIAAQAEYLDGRCELCWLGGTRSAVKGRCEKHRDWVFDNHEKTWSQDR